MALRILIVEDEESLASLSADWVDFWGFDTVWAKRWPRGIDLVQSKQTDLFDLNFVGLDAANLRWHHGGAANSQRKRYSDFDDDSQNQTADVGGWSWRWLDDI